MNYRVLALAAAVTAGLLSACADDYGMGPPPAYADVDYGAFYDGYYGPFYGGYWGPGGYFYYSDGGHRFHRDASHHFRHDSGGPSYHSIQGHAPPSPHSGRHSERR